MFEEWKYNILFIMLSFVALYYYHALSQQVTLFVLIYDGINRSIYYECVIV